jgi:DNA primase catalytic subunit
VANHSSQLEGYLIEDLGIRDAMSTWVFEHNGYHVHVLAYHELTGFTLALGTT